jgi:hypothetical protein
LSETSAASNRPRVLSTSRRSDKRPARNSSISPTIRPMISSCQGSTRCECKEHRLGQCSGMTLDDVTAEPQATGVSAGCPVRQLLVAYAGLWALLDLVAVLPGSNPLFVGPGTGRERRHPVLARLAAFSRVGIRLGDWPLHGAWFSRVPRLDGCVPSWRHRGPLRGDLPRAGGSPSHTTDSCPDPFAAPHTFSRGVTLKERERSAEPASVRPTLRGPSAG